MGPPCRCTGGTRCDGRCGSMGADEAQASIRCDTGFGIGKRWGCGARQSHLRGRRLCINALMSGVSPDGQHSYPALPYTSYAHMRVQDVKDLMAYLRTLPQVQGRPPQHDLPFPFSIRCLIGFWKLLHLDPEWNRGRYLVEAVTHCAECHSARNLANAIVESSRLAGGYDQEGAGYVPNITPSGIGHWSRADTVRVLTDGHTPESRQIGSSMADVVSNTADLPLADREAIATYILALPARHSPDAVMER